MVSKSLKYYLIYLIILLLILSTATALEKDSTLSEINDNTNLIYQNNVLDFKSLTLRQKIAQMVITYAKPENNKALNKMLIGGIFLDTQPSKKDFQKIINKFKKDSKIPLFISVDLEGCKNPFKNFQEFTYFSEIKTPKESYETAILAGSLLNELGINMNFAPVLDLEDNIWNCRNFNGNIKEVITKSNAYIKGLKEKNIIIISKHYPGKTLSTTDPHTNSVHATIEEKDLIPFNNAIKNDVQGIMISHLIVNGTINSLGKPSLVSSNIIKNLKKNFSGLIVTDEIGMQALKNYYSKDNFTNYKQMFIDLINADNDIILTFNKNPHKIYEMIRIIENATIKGEINEKKIDESVRKILKYKKIKVIN